MNYRVPPKFLVDDEESITRRLTRIETRLCHLMVHLGAGAGTSPTEPKRQPPPDGHPSNPARNYSREPGEWK